MMDGVKGPYILLDRTFNPAGVGGNDGRESIIVSLYEPKDNQGQQPSPTQQQHSQQKANAYQSQRPIDDDVPF
jgi:hypothetical protein